MDDKLLSHYNNITQKERIADTQSRIERVREVREQYALLDSALSFGEVQSGWLDAPVDALNQYLDFVKLVEKADSFFNWRSDFAGSVIPEFLYRMLSFRLSKAGITGYFSTRDSVVELTLSGFLDGGWTVRRKNQDLCMGLRHETMIIGGKEVTFVVPVIVFEVKTNIDINKLNGLDFSAERLKRTFPSARYILVTETIDFSLDENHAGDIDEIYVLRKQLRSVSRKTKHPLHANVFEELAEHVFDVAFKASATRGHVYDRLDSGRLINV